jgi:CheY-like chemotaxis protein
MMTTKTVHVPLSLYTVTELHARAAELRHMADMASTDRDVQALKGLGLRFDAVAQRREAEDHEAHSAAQALAMRMIEAEQLDSSEHESMPGPDSSIGPLSAEALQIATDAISRHYVLPETRWHPAIQSASMELAYLLMAYGLVSTKLEPTAIRSEISAYNTGHNILVVDDVNDVLVTVGAFLVNAGFAVQKASNGDEALKMIVTNPQIDVLVTDFAMPGLTGADLIAQAIQIRPSLKALIITGYPNADGLAELPPRTTILVKPFRRDTLIAAVKSLFGEMRPIPNETVELIENIRL